MQIKKTSDIATIKINMLIFGESGIGKTFLASTLPCKTIIVSLESGLLSLRNKNIDYVEINNLGQLKETLIELSTSDYDNIYIDSLTEINQLFFEHAKEQYPDDKQTLKLYGLQLDIMTRFIKFCRDIPKHVFFTALQKTTQDEYSRRFFTPDLTGSIATKCPAYFDFVFNYQMIKSEDKNHRVLVTSKLDNVLAKDRSGTLETYESPDLSAIMNKIF